MIDLTTKEERILSSLLDPYGPAAVAWLSRVQHSLSQLWPEAFVFRLRARFEDLVRWAEEAGVERRAEQLHQHVHFEDDRDAPKAFSEGGWLRFTWSDAMYYAFAVMAPGARYSQTYTWIVCPHPRRRRRW